MKVLFGTALVLWLLPAVVCADMRILSETEIRLFPDSSNRLTDTLFLNPVQILWIDVDRRIMQVDELDGLSYVYYADSLGVVYCKSDDFETYDRMVMPGSSQDTSSNFFEDGLALVPARPTIIVDSTGIEETINGYSSCLFRTTYILAGDTTVAEAWVTMDIPYASQWMATASAPGPNYFTEGFPVRTIMYDNTKIIINNMTSVTESNPPPGAYSIPAHYEFKPQ